MLLLACLKSAQFIDGLLESTYADLDSQKNTELWIIHAYWRINPKKPTLVIDWLCSASQIWSHAVRRTKECWRPIWTLAIIWFWALAWSFSFWAASSIASLAAYECVSVTVYACAYVCVCLCVRTRMLKDTTNRPYSHHKTRLRDFRSNSGHCWQSAYAQHGRDLHSLQV